MNKFHTSKQVLFLLVATIIFGIAAILMMKHPAKASPSSNTYVLNRSIVHVSGTLSANANWNAQHIYVVDNQLTISSGITLTINHGTIVKYAFTGQNAITVSSGGILNVFGTSADPVIFTSYKDDSAGGDTNGDGNASSPAPGDYGAAITIGASLSNVKMNVSYADFRYGTQSLSLSCVFDSNVSATITDSTIEDQVYAYGCEAGQGKLTLQRNHFALPTSTSDTAVALYYSDPSGVILAGTNENTFTGSGKQVTVFALGNSANIDLPHGSTWTLASTSGAVIDVDNLSIAGTLNIGAGIIVKTEQQANGFILDSGSTLKVNGTSSAPVIFTSSKDDSVGGDTNGDGPSSGAPGDYGTAIMANNSSGAMLNVSFADFRYGTQALALSCTSSSNVSATVTDSTIEEQVSAYACEAGQGKLILQRNHFALANGDPNTAITLYYSDPSGIILAGSNENTFTGTGTQIAVLVSSNGTIDNDIPAGSTWTIAGTSGAVIEAQQVGIAGTLNLNAGAVVKVVSSTNGFYVQSGGSLNAAGTSSSPVIFTSAKDDSVGGDTNGDGPSTGAVGDYGAALIVNNNASSNVTMSISHAEFRYGTQSLSLNCVSGSNVSAIVTNSVVKSQMSTYGCEAGQGKLTLQRNHFELAANDPSMPITLYYSDPSGIILAGANQNIFTGSGTQIAVLVSSNGTIDNDIPAGSTWTIAGTSGAVIDVHQVGIAGTLTLNAGAVVKVISSTDGFYVHAGGSLNASGTSSKPVIFTSDKDDSVGGDTNGDGPSTGTVGDYGAAISTDMNASNIWLSLTSIKFKYATTALNLPTGQANLESTSISNVYWGLEVSGDAQVIYRGSFRNVKYRAIQSCDWSEQASCTVDAAYTDWGSVNGPLSSNPNNNMACGAVSISPWKYGTSTYTITDNPDVYDVRNCGNSATPSAQLTSAVSGFQAAINLKQIDCSNGFQDACDAIQTAYACLSGAMNVAQSTTPWPIPPASTADQVNAWGGLFRGAAADYLSAQEVVSVPSTGFLIGNYLINLTGTFITMVNAYSSCAP